MITQQKFERHYEENIVINTDPKSIFSYADDHTNFSSHMNKSSLMMGGGSMNTATDEGKGKKIGSHITMSGKVLGINLFLDEVITKHDPPFKKEWRTVGKINLLVIDHYRLGFEITPKENNSRLEVYIDYNLPQSFFSRLLGYLLGDFYAKWCVRQMINSVKEQFNKSL